MRLILVVILLLSFRAQAWEVSRTTGEVTVTRGKAKAVKAVDAEALKEGDTVITGAAGKALIKDGESEVWLAPKTSFQIHKLADSEQEVIGRLDVLKGKIRAKFKRPSGPEEFPYQVKAKTVFAGVRGTMFLVAVEDGEEKVCTMEGLVRVSSVGASSKNSAEGWDVPAGKGLFIRPGEMPRVRETNETQKKNWIDATTF